MRLGWTLRVPACLPGCAEGLAALGGGALAAMAYDLSMRRLFLCFLLCLMPLRLWAGVWMPVPDHAAHPASTERYASLAQSADTPHECHEADGMHPAQQLLPAAHEAAVHQADCQEGTCQLCAVCHQSAGLAAWPLVVSVAQANPLPAGAFWAHAARTSSPLTKPPIS